MELSRKRKRELKKLRNHAEDLLDHQREVLTHANAVLSEAGRQAKELGNEHLVPRVEDAVDQIRPQLERNIQVARRAADRVKTAAAPVVAAALAGTVKQLEKIESRDASQKLQAIGAKYGLIEQPKKKRGIGRIFAIIAGLVAASAAGYALWQAFRDDDDDMWVSSDDL